MDLALLMELARDSENPLDLPAIGGLLEGEETEVDRTVVEKLSDPLMHMIANAVDLAGPFGGPGRALIMVDLERDKSAFRGNEPVCWSSSGS